MLSGGTRSRSGGGRTRTGTGTGRTSRTGLDGTIATKTCPTQMQTTGKGVDGLAGNETRRPWSGDGETRMIHAEIGVVGTREIEMGGETGETKSARETVGPETQAAMMKDDEADEASEKGARMNRITDGIVKMTIGETEGIGGIGEKNDGAVVVPDRRGHGNDVLITNKSPALQMPNEHRKKCITAKSREH